MINIEEILSENDGKFGIEFESIVVNSKKHDYACIDNHRIYDEYRDEHFKKTIDTFLEEEHFSDIFNYNPSLDCEKNPSQYKRIEFASYAFYPYLLKPYELFDKLEKSINKFNEWTNEKYYLPTHGTFSYFEKNTNKQHTTVTGGTHITVSFPITKKDNPTRWKVFVYLFIGLVTMYQPIYIALNGAPSFLTKGSERQRRSPSVTIGSSNLYNIIKSEHNRYEMYINTPSGYFKYYDFSHWRNHDVKYKYLDPWYSSLKGDIGNSNVKRANFFDIGHFMRNLLVESSSEFDKIIKKTDFPKKELIHIIGIEGATSSLFEFRFFDNEPPEYLLEKFNLIIRMADFAYEESIDIENSVGTNGLETILDSAVDHKFNIRMFVNKKVWHDAVNKSMKDGLDTRFDEEFIDECYKYFETTQLSNALTNQTHINGISAIEIQTILIDTINKSSRHFSDYFNTSNPKDVYSKKYQIEMYEKSVKKSDELKKKYDELNR